MTPKPTRWNELHLAENPAVQLLQSLDYTYIPPEDLEPERASFKEAILTGRLVTALERLNPWLSDTNLTKAVKTVTQVPALRDPLMFFVRFIIWCIDIYIY